jgi:hypothetical protein
MSNCDIIILDCSRSSDLKRLKHLQKIEREQKSHFTYFLTLNEWGCKSKDIIYFIAIKQDSNNEQLCGVAQTESTKHVVSVNYLTSRAATDKSYKGTGTKLLDAIVKLYKDDPRFLGIKLSAVESAEKFYINYGFKPATDDPSFMFYPFAPYNTLQNYNKKMLKTHLKISVFSGDKKTLDNLLIKNNISLRDIIQTNNTKPRTNTKYIYLNKFLIENYFNELDIHGGIFYDNVKQENYDMMLYLLNKNPEFIDILDDYNIKEIIRNSGGPSLTNILKELHNAGYKYNEELLMYLIKIRPNEAAIKAMYGSGIKLTNREFILEYQDELFDLEKRYKALKAAVDIWKNYFKD